MADIEKLQELASQLRHPIGVKGIETGNSMNESNTGMTITTIEELNIIENDIVFELGHGHCKHLEYIFKEMENVVYHGLDISTLMFEESLKANEIYIHEKKADFTLFDGCNIPHSDNYFDKGFCVNTIYFWENPLNMLTEIHRVLKPNGLFNITFGSEEFMQQLPFTKFGFNLYNEDKIQELISASPFKLVQVKRIAEKIKAKDGSPIDRDYYIATIQKIENMVY